MYFNSISVKEREIKISLYDLLNIYLFKSKESSVQDSRNSKREVLENVIESCEPRECLAIRKLRRLSINPGFIYHNYQYLKECKEDDSVNTVYMRYIDQQYQICLMPWDITLYIMLQQWHIYLHMKDIHMKDLKLYRLLLLSIGNRGYWNTHIKYTNHLFL